MVELHSTQCACQDCRNRRLIRDDAYTTERYAADELEDFGYVLKSTQLRQEEDLRTRHDRSAAPEDPTRKRVGAVRRAAAVARS